MKKICLLFLGLLGACQAIEAPNYAQKLEPWIGQSRATLYRRWGEPMRQFSLAGNRVVAVYLKQSSRPLHDNFYPYRRDLNYAALAGPRYGLSMYPSVYYCETLFTLQNDVVVDYSFNGDDCF